MGAWPKGITVGNWREGGCAAQSFKRPRATDEKKKSLLYFGCDFVVWYNFGKIIEIIVTRCHILKLKCTKFDLGWGCAPEPTGKLTTLPQTP